MTPTLEVVVAIAGFCVLLLEFLGIRHKRRWPVPSVGLEPILKVFGETDVEDSRTLFRVCFCVLMSKA